MPDGMSSENRPITPDFHIGAPAKLPANETSMQVAQNEFKPEWKSKMPDIRMELSEEDEAKRRALQDEAASRIFRIESLHNEQISFAEEPQELFYGLREMERKMENGNIPHDLSEHWTPPRELSMMFERANMLKIKASELEKRGWIKNYDPETGVAEPKNPKYAFLAISITPYQDKEDVDGHQFRVTKYRHNFGKETDTINERETLAKAYDKAVLELEARSILDQHIGVRRSLRFRDNLEGLTALMHDGGMPYFTTDHLTALFNMPDVDEMASKPDNHLLGDQLEEAIFLNLVMLNSGTKDKMKSFLERPGAQHLMAKLAKEKAEREGLVGYTTDDWIHENIGYINGYKWKDSQSKEHDGWVENEKRDLKKTWREEQKCEIKEKDGKVNHLRGELTKWANIIAWGGKTAEFSTNDENAFLEHIDKLVGSKDASWLAATLMRDIGAYGSEGYVAIKGQTLLPLGEGRYLSGDDTGKYRTYMFNLKEGFKGQSSGLKDMIGRIPDMAMNLFDWAGVKVSDLPLDKDGAVQRRSIWDAWLGTVGGKPKIDLLTMKPVNSSNPEMKTNFEPYHRLGDLDFGSLERDFHGSFTIMQWLMGNREGPTGVYVDAMKTNFRFEDDFTLDSLKKKIKYINIVMNPVVLTQGSQHLYANIDNSCTAIKKNFFNNLMSARLNSASFAQTILPATSRLYTPTGGVVEVSQAKLVKLFIEEAQKDTEIQTEEQLIRHYVDENGRLRTVGAGLGKEIAEIVDGAKFTDDVGRVVGKNCF